MLQSGRFQYPLWLHKLERHNTVYRKMNWKVSNTSWLSRFDQSL